MWSWLKSFIMRLSAKKSFTSFSDTRSVCVCMHVHAYDHKLCDTWDIVHNIQN